MPRVQQAAYLSEARDPIVIARFGAASTDPALLQMARAPLALPPKPNGATPGSIAVAK